MNQTIFEAIDQQDIQLIKQILSKSSDLRVYDPISYEDTPLHRAIRLKNLEITKLLINAGAPLEARNKFDDTPLHLAAAIGNKEIILALLDAGADLTSHNDNYKTPLDIAKDAKYTEIVRLIENYISAKS